MSPAENWKRIAVTENGKSPYNCHAAILERLSGTVSLFDSLCNVSLNFVRKCLNCGNILVNFVLRHAVFHSRMCSVMSRNVQYLCERFGACRLDVTDSSKQWKLMADEGIDFIVSRAGMIQELVVVRDRSLCMSTDDFTHNDVLALIGHFCVD